MVHARIAEALEQAKHSGKTWWAYADLDTGVDCLVSAENSWIVGGYLVVFGIDRPWFSKHLFLYEEIVCRLYGNAPFSVVTDFLQAAAAEAGAVVIASGSILSRSDAAVARLYERAGFQLTGLTMTKETHVL